jgi:hypothetical protein
MTSASQPIGLMPRTRPFWLALGRPRPTAGGYSSRSNPGRVGRFSSSRSRRDPGDDLLAAALEAEFGHRLLDQFFAAP